MDSGYVSLEGLLHEAGRESKGHVKTQVLALAAGCFSF